MSGNLSKDAIIRQLIARGVPREQAERAAEATSVVGGHRATIKYRGGVGQHMRMARDLGDPESAFDLINGVLRMVFFTPPRTKKNHLRWFGVQSIPYTRYRDFIVDQVGRAADEMYPNPLEIPLPDIPYNLAATFYVDGPGERADRFGLEQGLADALQDAGVVTNDWHFRTGDGTRIIVGDPRPRVEAIISPIEDL